jgi:hypothetical protein
MTETIFTHPQGYTIPADILIPSDATIDAVLNSMEPLSATPAQTQHATGVLMNVSDASELVNKTVFLKTRFGAMGNSRKVSGDVLDTDANKERLKVSKTLLDSPELDAIKKADGKMRQWLYNTCLPFDMGIMLLPIGLIETAEEKMKSYREERSKLVEEFLAVYPSLQDSAAQQLGSLYNASDYPVAEEIRQKYTFEWQYTTFTVPGSLKNISAALFEAEKEKMQETIANATADITALMRETLHKLVGHLQERLAPGDEGKPKILKESAIKNLNEFLDTLDLRNVTGDKELAAQGARARALVNGISAKSLKSNDELRSQILNGLDGIMDSLNDMVEVKPGRKFLDEDDE